MAVDIPVIRAVVERACAREDVLDACRRRDLGTVIMLLCAEGVTQGQLSVLTGIPQGRLSEYKTHKRVPQANSTFEAFADGLGMPPAARRALGLDPRAAGSAASGASGAWSPGTAGVSMRDVRPVLSSLSRASAIPVLSGLRAIHRGYVEADRQMGSMCITGPMQLQMPIVEKVCEVTRGADRVEMLQFACRFVEFGGWLFQDAGDLACAMHWTDRALDYALELGDQRIIAYTLMRKAMIATESGNPAQGVGIANYPLSGRRRSRRGSGQSSCGSGPTQTPSWGKFLPRQGILMMPFSRPSQASSKSRRIALPIARRLMWKWKPGHPGLSWDITGPPFPFWKEAVQSGLATLRYGIMRCACHGWQRHMPVSANWSRRAPPPWRLWNLPRGSARAAWLARSAWFIVALEGGSRILPWLACEGA